MGFYEDDRIRNKNKQPKAEAMPDKTHTFDLVISETCSLSKLLKILNDNDIDVSLRGTNTIVIE